MQNRLGKKTPKIGAMCEIFFLGSNPNCLYLMTWEWDLMDYFANYTNRNI